MSEPKGCLPNHHHLAGVQCSHLDQVDAICGNPKFPLQVTLELRLSKNNVNKDYFYTIKSKILSLWKYDCIPR